MFHQLFPRALLRRFLLPRNQVQCFYSKNWKFRQEAAETLNKELTTDSPELIGDKDYRNVTRAVIFLLKKGMKDGVWSVCDSFKKISTPISLTSLLLGKRILV